MSNIADIKDFLFEAEENIAKLEAVLLKLENNKSNLQLVEEALRYAHSIKGGASFFALNNIVNLSHKLEAVFKRIVDNSIELTSELFDIMLLSKDSLSDLLNDFENQFNYDITSVLNQLSKYLDEEFSENPLHSIDEIIDETAYKDSSNLGYYFYRYHTLNEQVFNVDFSEIKKVSKIVSFKKKQNTFEVYFGTPLELNLIELLIDINNATLKYLKEISFGYIQKKYNENIKSTTSKESKIDETIRVKTKVLDELLNSVGELILEKNKLKNTILLDDKNIDELKKQTFEIERLTDNLHNTILETRLRNIETVFRKFPRVVRNLSRDVGKNIIVEVYSNDVNVDKIIIEKIYDPLTHLIRNAVDHGIELPNERKRVDKSDTATIRLIATSEEGNVVIQVSDDGRGINPENVLNKAIEKNVLSEDDILTLTEKEKINLIFHSGFSTKDEVSSMSGRGVGLDVVRDNIESIGGTIEVQTEVGKGSTFTITVPLAVAIFPSIVAKSNDMTFIIPRNSVDEVIFMQEDDEFKVTKVKEDDYLLVRNKLIPIVCLTKMLSVEEDVNLKKFIIVKSNELKLAIPVDEIVSSEDILIKDAPKLLHTMIYDSVSISADGTVIPIIDVRKLCRLVNLTVKSHENQGTKESIKNIETKPYLNVILNDQKDYLIPVDKINRLVRIKSSEIKKLDKRYYVSIDGKRFLLHINHVDKLSKKDSNEKVVVILRGRNNLGVLVDGINVVEEVDKNIKVKAIENETFLGTISLNDRLCTILNIKNIKQSINHKGAE